MNGLEQSVPKSGTPKVVAETESDISPAISILRSHISSRLSGKTEGLEQVLRCFHPISAKKSQSLLTAGEVCTQVYFVARGALQVFVLAPNAEETTRDVILEGGWCSDLASFSKQAVAAENIRALEDSSLLSIGKRDFDELNRTLEPFSRCFQQILLDSHTRYVDRINALVSLNSTQRINWLEENRPELMRRFSQKLLASYLGVSQETFSRLK